MNSHFKRFLYIFKNYGLSNAIISIIRYIFFFRFKKINLDKKNYNLNNNTLDQIFYFFGTDKANFVGKQIYKGMKSNYTGHNYSIFYEKYFKELRDKKLNILELGVQRGFSTASFYYYFPLSNFYCLDIDKKKIMYTSSRINNFELNLRDQKKVSKFVDKYENYFDIVIDDASHYQRCILENLDNFSKTLKNNSYYVIEDYNQPEIFSEKLDAPSEPNISNLLHFLLNKRDFQSDIISKKTKKFLNENISDIGTHKGNRPESTIAFIKFGS